MRVVDEVDAKNRLTALLRAVEGGEVIAISRRRKPIARLSRVEDGFDRAKARAAAHGLRAASKGQRLDGLALGDLIRTGRA